MIKGWIFAAMLACLGNHAVAAQSMDAPPGELLYSTHCIACHSAQIHWRDKKIAADWTGLKEEVRHWQEVTGLDWSDGEIAEVAHYLNVRFYHFSEDSQ